MTTYCRKRQFHMTKILMTRFLRSYLVPSLTEDPIRLRSQQIYVFRQFRRAQPMDVSTIGLSHLCQACRGTLIRAARWTRRTLTSFLPKCAQATMLQTSILILILL